MADILRELHRFVPTVRNEQVFHAVTDDDDEVTEPACVKIDYFKISCLEEISSL